MKRYLLTGLSLVLFSLLFMMIRDGRDIDRDLKLKGNSFIEDIHIIQKRDGEKLWTIFAKRADFLEGENEAKLTDMSLVMQKNDIVLYTDSGIYNISDKSFNTNFLVKAKAKDFLITAEAIDYDISTGKIVTDGRVVLDSENIRIEGKGLKTATGETIKILDDVKAIFYE